MKRGYWVVRRVLGERIPAPPPTVPELPKDEANLGALTLPELLARHRADLGLADVVEELDAEGRAEPLAERRRERLGGREADPIGEGERHLARGVGEVGEEARRARVHGRAIVVCDLDLETARPGAAVDDQVLAIAEYWRWWSDAIIHRVHLRVLNHIRTLAEADGKK